MSGAATSIIEPIDAACRQRVVDLTQDYVNRAGILLGCSFPAVEVRFDLRGSSAGMFRVQGDNCHIRYNPWLFAKYLEENLSGTIPHEVAHYIVHRTHGMHRVRPHGPEWKALMAAFGADDSVTGDYDLTGIPLRRQRRFSYTCGCRVHELTTRRHNNICRGVARYQCRLCSGELIAC